MKHASKQFSVDTYKLGVNIQIHSIPSPPLANSATITKNHLPNPNAIDPGTDGWPHIIYVVALELVPTA